MQVIIDRGRAGDVVAALGRERYQILLGRLRGEVAAVGSGDVALQPALHRLRGSSATLGLDGLAAALTAIEAMIGPAPRAEVMAALAALDPLIDASVAALGIHDGGGATKR